MTVFVIHEPVRFDRSKRMMVPIDLSPARSFGPLHIILTGHDRPPPIADCADALKAAMARFMPTDRLLIAGDMDLVVFAAILATEACKAPPVLLKWSARNRRYDEIAAPAGLLGDAR